MSSPNIAPTTADSVLAPSGLGPSVGGLTPESILAYCQNRMDSLDSRVQVYMDREEKKGELQKEIGNLQSLLPGNRVNGDDGDYHYEFDKDAVQASIDKIDGLAGDLGVDTSNIDRVAGLTCGDGNDNEMCQSEADTTKASLDAASSAVSSGMELDMIQLQSLVQQRQTAIQLSTNLVTSIDEGPKAIAQNIRG